MITQVAVGRGPGRTLVNGVCVARTTIRQTRPRCLPRLRAGTLPTGRPCRTPEV
jgi:hypothetical protein